MSPVADICLVLEGTYPFVMGGVSAWVHHLIQDQPNLTFHLWYIAANEGDTAMEPVYELPPNVVGLSVVALHGKRSEDPKHSIANLMRPGRSARAASKWLPEVAALSELLFRGHQAPLIEVLQNPNRKAPRPVDPLDVLVHPESWEAMLDLYRKEAPHESFANFFWTWINSATPPLRLLMAPIPEARAYHTVSTGYAGLLAARASYERSAPMALTEHGIYTKERRIDINQADWILERPRLTELAERDPAYFRGWWIRLFQAMSQFTYAASDRLLTIHHGNTVLQRKDGAPEGRPEVIPNGVDVTKIMACAAGRKPRAVDAPFVIGFIGRVAPIKDIETLLDSMALLSDTVPHSRLRIMGPMSEDAEYAERCQAHLQWLGLDGRAAFEGTVKLVDVLPEIDVLVLTSISEAQPLVLLEAGAAGIPVVATNVGACHELVHGRTDEDKALGPGGFVTPIGSPRATAEALARLANDPKLCQAMGKAGEARVQRFYTQTSMIDAYRSVYGELLSPAGAGLGSDPLPGIRGAL